ncbi:MAG: hypothetical protein U1E17_04510 [Geminicoccaceae bacterium]
MIRQIRACVPAVFFENIADRADQQITRETDAKIGGALFRRALGPEVRPPPISTCSTPRKSPSASLGPDKELIPAGAARPGSASRGAAHVDDEEEPPRHRSVRSAAPAAPASPCRDIDARDQERTQQRCDRQQHGMAAASRRAMCGTISPTKPIRPANAAACR